MRYVAAYMLATLGGKKNPSAQEIKDILGSVGIEADGALLDKVISELSGKNIAEIIEQGKGKLATIPTGGGVASSGSAPAAAAASEAKEEKKEEKKESESESDEDMGFGLFD